MKLFEILTEIDIAYLPKTTSWRDFDRSPDWYRSTLFPIKFQTFDVLIIKNNKNIKFIILNPKKYEKPEDMPKHKIAGINQDIPMDAIVGGVDLTKVSGGPIGYSWKVDYLAFNPEYQGQKLPLKFYKWLIENYKTTGINVIKAGGSQTPGSQKLWADLSKTLTVFAYNPITKKISPVEIGDDGKLEAEFVIYPPEDEAELQAEYSAEFEALKSNLENNQISPFYYKMRKTKLKTQLKQELANVKRIVLYAMPNIRKTPNV